MQTIEISTGEGNCTLAALIGDTVAVSGTLAEPAFVLRGKDTYAPQILRQWAAAYEANSYCDSNVLRQVLDCAQAMEDWQNGAYGIGGSSGPLEPAGA